MPAGQELKCQAARDDRRRRDDGGDDGGPPRNAPSPHIALPCARPTDLRWRRGRFFRPALLPGTRFGTGHVLADHHRLYIRLAAARARVHPARFPCASSRLARAKVAANVAFACCSARLIEAGVG